MGEKLGPVQYYDKKGYPCLPGDVLRVFHFIAAKRRERMYMYKVVSTDGMSAINISDIPRKGLEHSHSCPMRCLGDFEIVDGYEFDIRPRSRDRRQC